MIIVLKDKEGTWKQKKKEKFHEALIWGNTILMRSNCPDVYLFNR